MAAAPGERQWPSEPPRRCCRERVHPLTFPSSPACRPGGRQENAGKRKNGAHQVWLQVVSGAIDCLVMMLFTAVSAGVILVLGM
ncbi:MAG: hypothetical protein P8X55_02820 [Desulfosarcinaceae bacterium]